MVAAALLFGARALSGDEQFPRGLLAAEPRTGGGRACAIETRPLSFGVYDPLADNDLDAAAEIIYTCASGNGGGGGGGGGGRGRGGGGGGGSGGNDKQTIRIELGVGWANTFERKMVGPGGAVLSYNIYLDATHRSIWGNGFAGTEVYLDSHPPNGTPVIVTAFGRIFARQNAESGQYVDVVHAVILF
jgi:spore coat protein U-like protein